MQVDVCFSILFLGHLLSQRNRETNEPERVFFVLFFFFHFWRACCFCTVHGRWRFKSAKRSPRNEDETKTLNARNVEKDEAQHGRARARTTQNQR